MIEKWENIKNFSFPHGIWFGMEKWRQLKGWKSRKIKNKEMIEKLENIKNFSFPRGVWFGVEKQRQRVCSLNKFNFMPYQIKKR